MTLRDFLDQHGLSAYLEACEAAHFTLDDLTDLGDEDLKTTLRMALLADRKRFRAAVETLRQAPQPDSTVGVASSSQGSSPLSGPTRVQPSNTPTAGSLSGATRVAPTGAPPTPSAPGLGNVAISLPNNVGSYRVLGLIGAGGMGTVVRARHTEEGWAARQGGDVAIKLIHPQIASDPAFRDRFLAEADLGRLLRHPSLVSTWEVVTEGGWLGIVMSLLSGEPLTHRVRPGGLPVDEVVRILTGIGGALDYLHGQGIVHRDVKPANIMLKDDGGAVLIDLGIAKDAAAKESHTRTMTAMGTSAWMAPEQADAKRVDGAADRYALGLVAYALLAGRPPWSDADSEARILTNKLTGQLTALDEAKKGVPRGASAAVMRMVSVAPSDRYPTCAAFIAALQGAKAPAVPSPAVESREEQPRPPPPSARTSAVPQEIPRTRTFDPLEEAPEPRSSGLGGGLVALALGAVGLGVVSIAVVGGFLWLHATSSPSTVATAALPQQASLGPSPSPAASPAPTTAPAAPAGGSSPPSPRVLPVGYEVDNVDWACPDCAPLPVASVVASSSLHEGKRIYSPDQLASEAVAYPWCEGVPGWGVGESVTVKFATTRQISAIRFLPFYAKGEEPMFSNGRVKSLRITTDGGELWNVNFEDQKRGVWGTAQLDYTQPYVDIAAKTGVGHLVSARWIRAEITGVFQGDKYQDTCMSGLQVSGK